MRKTISIIAVIFSVALVLSSCGTKAKSYGGKNIGKYTIYKANVDKVTLSDDLPDFVVSGTINAPDGTKVYASTPEKGTFSYGENAASKTDDILSFAKVKNGKFKVEISPESIKINGKSGYTQKQKISAMIFGIGGLDKKSFDATFKLPKSTMNGITEVIKPTSFTLSDDMVSYYNKLMHSNKPIAFQPSNSKDKHRVDILSYKFASSTDLMNNPEDYVGKKIYFTSLVVASGDADNLKVLKFSYNENYPKGIFSIIPKDKLKGMQISKGDIVTVYGKGIGSQTFKSKDNQVTLSGVDVDEIDNDTNHTNQQ